MKIPKDPTALKSLELVWAERLRQKEEEGYTPEYDDGHTHGQLGMLAAYYSLTSAYSTQYESVPDYITASVNQLRRGLELFDWRLKPVDPIRDLVRAGALILAELERRLRAEDEGSGPCSACQTETTYTGEHNGDYGVWLCPDHGGKP